MAMDHDSNLSGQASTTGNAKVYEPVTAETPRGRSNMMAFLIGGLVIALGLLAFLFYPGDGRDVSTTGSTTTQSAPATSPVTTPTAPATTTPAAPTNPTPRQ